jgi:NAD(P)-dependent dehydrogenase (short-subunit alcohol dehydrogenase family)
MDVKGAVALVTGGNGGLGQRICYALARQGVHIGVMYVQSRDQADDVVRGLASRHQIEGCVWLRHHRCCRSFAGGQRYHRPVWPTRHPR